MANSEKNIVITPARGSSTDDPKIVFSGADASTAAQNVTAKIYPTSNGTLSFEGAGGQLLAITNNSSGVVYSVNDISGIPAIQVQESGDVQLVPYGGNVTISGTLKGIDVISGITTGSGYSNTSWVKIATAPPINCSATMELTYTTTEAGYFHDSAAYPYDTNYLTPGGHQKYLLSISSSIGTGGYYGYSVRFNATEITNTSENTADRPSFTLYKNSDNSFDLYMKISQGISIIDSVLSNINIAIIINNNCSIYRNNFTSIYTLPAGTAGVDYSTITMGQDTQPQTIYSGIYYYYNYWYGGGFNYLTTSKLYRQNIRAAATNSDVVYTRYIQVSELLAGVSSTWYLDPTAGSSNTKLQLAGDINLGVGSGGGSSVYTGIVIPRRYTQSGGTSGPSITGDGLRRYDFYRYDAVSSNFTLTADGGSPKQTYEGQKIMIRIKATASITITLGSGGTYPWRQIVTVPTSMVSGEVLYIGAVFNSTDSKWDIIAAKKGS